MVDPLAKRYEQYFRHPDANHEVLQVGDRAVACSNLRRSLAMLNVSVDPDAKEEDLFDASLRERGSRLIVRRGPALEALRILRSETKATAVVWNRRYEPALVERDRRIQAALRQDGCDVETFNSALLFEPGTVVTREGRPYQVFSAFWKTCAAIPEPSVPRAASTPAGTTPRRKRSSAGSTTPAALPGPRRAAA